MAYYSYKVTRDYGFAPNPFFGYCTLACCKPNIRKKANVGDWIIGTGAIENNLLYNLIYFMQISEKLTFEDYWKDERFICKRPQLEGSLKQIHGDNIYYKENNEWFQMDSHHAHYGGKLNQLNLKQDLSGNFVLISNHFVYLGNKHIRISDKYIELCPNNRQRDYITVQNQELADDFIKLVIKEYHLGVCGQPINWSEYDFKQLYLF